MQNTKKILISGDGDENVLGKPPWVTKTSLLTTCANGKHLAVEWRADCKQQETCQVDWSLES